MRIQNLKDPQPGMVASPGPASATTGARGGTHGPDDGGGRVIDYPGQDRPGQDRTIADRSPQERPVDRQSLEIALLKARIKHLELVIETARGLMGGNQERLLRRLHEVPREMAELSAQLRRVDPHAVC